MTNTKIAIEMPTTPAEITAVWLTEALRSTGTIGIETAVSSLVVEPMNGAGYAGQVTRVVLTYNSSTTLPNTLIAKFSHPDPNVREALHDLYLREVHLYQTLMGDINLYTPECYYSAVDAESGHAILLLEDLGHLRTGDIAQGCTVGDAEAVIAHFARHHAQWWEHPLLETDAYLKPDAVYDLDWLETYQGWWSQFEENVTMAHPDTYLPTAFLDLGKRAAQQLQALYNKVAATPFTLIHKDTHLDNLLFATDENDPPLTVIDWQLCNAGPGVSDITYFMISSMSVRQRRQSEYRLIKIYHALLLKHGITNYSFKQCWRDYRLAFFRNLVVTTAVIGLMDLTRPHAKAFIPALVARLIAFAEDHAVSDFLVQHNEQVALETAVVDYLSTEFPHTIVPLYR